MQGPKRRQIVACLCANLMTATHGASNGWMTANFVALQRSDSLLASGPMSLREATFFMSIYFSGAIFGNLIAPYLIRRYGSKSVITANAIPQILVYLLIIYARNPYYLYASSIVGGAIGSWQAIAMAIFVSEISDPKFRGSLISVYDTAYNIGAVIAFVLAMYCDMMNQAKYLLIMVFVFVALFLQIPKTPQYFIERNAAQAANKAQKFFKGTQLEILPLNEKGEQDNNKALTLSDFTNPRARRAISISFSLVSLYALQGTAVLSRYITEIFTNTTDTTVSPLFASVMSTVVFIVANLIYMNVVDRINRRTLYISSAVATAVGLTLFAIYLYFLAENPSFGWMPVVCVSLTLFVNCIGMYPVAWLIIIEILPKKLQHYGYSGCIMLMMINDCVFTEIYPLLKLQIGLFGWIVIFAVTTFGSAVYGYFFIPETRGKTHEAIMESLDRQNSNNTN